MHSSAFHKQLKFWFAATRKKNVIASQGMCNMAAVDLLSNNTVADGTSTNFKEVSRYIIEDIVCAYVGTTFLICISKETKYEFSLKLGDGTKEQRKLKKSGGDCKISGHLFHYLFVITTKADNHLTIKSGTIRLIPSLKKFNNHSGDFVLSIVGTDLTLDFSWQRLVLEASKIMVFGTPFTTTWSFDECFRGETDKEYLFHIIKSLVLEVTGDALLSSSLYVEYITRVNTIRGIQLQTKEASSDEDLCIQLQE